MIGKRAGVARQRLSLAFWGRTEKSLPPHHRLSLIARSEIRLPIFANFLLQRITPLLILFATSVAFPQAAPRIAEKAPKPLGQDQVLKLVQNYVPSARLAHFVKRRGIDFAPTEEFLRALRKAGAKKLLLKALREAKPAKQQLTETVELQAAEANTATEGDPIQQHLLRGADLEQEQLWSQAEQEYRSALPLDPENVAIHLALGRVLSGQNKLDEAIDEYRQALRLRPDSAEAHHALTMALFQSRDLGGAIGEYREVLRLKSDDAGGHINLGLALYVNGNLDAAIAEYRQAVRLNPGDAKARGLLGNALAKKADLDGAIVEFREAVRLEPDWVAAHYNLGLALEHKGDRQAAFEEYRIAYQLDPKDALLRAAYERLPSQ